MCKNNFSSSQELLWERKQNMELSVPGTSVGSIFTENTCETQSEIKQNIEFSLEKVCWSWVEVAEK